MAAVTVTLLRRRGDRGGNAFIGTPERPGEWPLLEQDESLKEQGVSFVTVEYDDLRSLVKDYGKVNRSPYIEFRITGDSVISEAYPSGKPLLAENIKAWILDFQKRNSAPSQASRSLNSDPSGSTGTTATPTDQTSKWRTPTIVAGSIIGVAGILIAGFLLWDWRKKNTVNTAEPLFMMDAEEDAPIDFHKVNFGDKERDL